MGINILIYCLASLWIAVILLLIGAYLLSRKYYALCKLYGVVVFLACFVLGGALVSLQLKQADMHFRIRKNLPLIRLFLRQSRKSRKTVFCFMPF